MPCNSSRLLSEARDGGRRRLFRLGHFSSAIGTKYRSVRSTLFEPLTGSDGWAMDPRPSVLNGLRLSTLMECGSLHVGQAAFPRHARELGPGDVMDPCSSRQYSAMWSLALGFFQVLGVPLESPVTPRSRTG